MIPSAFHSDRHRSPLKPKDSNALRSPGCGSLKCPDRFIPRRDDNSPIGEKFRTSKSYSSLTGAERLNRHRRASTDPFRPRLRATVPSALHVSSLSRIEGSTLTPAGKTHLRYVW